jgi:hypothetical protein
MENTFEKLNKIDVSKKVEKKGNLSYLSWAWAWSEFKKNNSNATYKVIRDPNTNLPYNFDCETGYIVFTEVTVGDLKHEMWLPVMDGANKAMKNKQYKYQTKYGEKICEPATMFDINKTIMRCLTKNLAMFGLGLYIYAGEDLPEQTDEEKEKIKLEAENELDSFKIELNKIKTTEKLREFYTKNSGRGKEYAKAITDRSAELEITEK